MNSLQLYFRYIGISFRGQMQYKASFIMMSIAAFIMGGLEFFAIWSLFDRFKTLRGWSLPEAAILYGIVNVAFSLTELVIRGFDTFAAMVKAGDFDRLLLRPRSTVLQLIGQELHLMRIGGLMQGLIILLWGIHTVGIDWTPIKLGLLLSSILGGACLFSGIIILQATMCFWTVESLEIVNTVTYGGVEATQYPLSIYNSWLRKFFTYIVPLAFISYYPSVAILGRANLNGINIFLYGLSPMVGIFFLIITLQIWKIGVRHYCSTGS